MKKFVQALTPKDIAKYLVLLLLLIVGILMSGFTGGLIAGSTGLCLVVAIVGKAIFAQTVARIDKGMKDTLTNQ